MVQIKDIKNKFEERFHQKWTSFSVLYHFKVLISKLTGLNFSEVLFHLNDHLTADQICIFDQFSDRLEMDEPLQHIVEETEFMGFPIICSPDALIPRPETEELVEAILAHYTNVENLKFIDLCTGSGCIAIALKKKLPASEALAIDFYGSTLDLAERNCKLNQVDILIQKKDVLSKSDMITFETGKFDFWVSNPPYIPAAEKLQMEKNVLDYEPHAALFTLDSDPLLFYRSIAQSAKEGLKNDGMLFFEIHENYGQETVALLEAENFMNVKIIQDLQGKNRIVTARNSRR